MVANKTLGIKSYKLEIKDIIGKDLRFNIPIYQRLYVWGEEQVNTLMGDLHNAYKQNSDKFYLGGIMLSKNNEVYDLIDGQQRFTTLWLLSKLLGNSLSGFTYTKDKNIDRARISFSVREFANSYFNANGQKLNLTVDEEEELKQIYEANDIINKYLSEEISDLDKKGFTDFIYEKVLFIATEMPPETDENKLFEAMNNRGVQLQQHEILKTRLLKLINDNELRSKYSLLWDACSIMDNYLERNIKEVANLRWETLFDEDDEGEKTVELPVDILNRIGKSEEKESITLRDILKDEVTKDDEDILSKISKKKEEDELYDGGKVRSIITFPMLLLHTLRIYEHRLKDLTDSKLSAEVKGKELIHIFESKNYFKEQQDVEEFIKLLWRVRQQFDRFIIKWVSNEDNTDETHLIKRLYQSKTAFQRREPISNEGFALLQSMLYHSQQITTFYWLTPFLNRMLNDEEDGDILDAQKLYKYLERLDNEMFCNEKRDLRTMSYDLMKKSDEELKGNQDFVKNELSEHKGTDYLSYWFYKLEYILWKNRDQLGEKDRWEHYKMTAKNSVEHISPQNPKDEDKNVVYDSFDSEEEKETKKNDFGNLVLITPVMNSEYSRKTFNVKRSEFKDKRRLDSLKSDLIFDHVEWNWDSCEEHREKMIVFFLEHLNKK